PHYLHW
ncbi:hypothetical protein D043_0449B, partial [Vibrio parahaemolyticus EKP-021]